MPRIFDFIAGVVTCVWALSFFIDALSKSYETSPFIHSMMTAIIGAYAGGKILTRGGE